MRAISRAIETEPSSSQTPSLDRTVEQIESGDATYYNSATLVVPFALMMELIVKDISENAVRLAVRPLLRAIDLC